MKSLLLASIGLVLLATAAAQQGIPPQPASGQQEQGTAAATAGKQTSDAGSPASPATTVTPAPQPPLPSANSEDTANLPASKPPTSAAPTPPPQPESPPPTGYGEGGTPIASPQPITKQGKLPTHDVDDPTDVSDLLPPAKIPKGTTSLIGGIVQKVDPVNQRLTVKPFGKHAPSVKVFFDARSHVFRNGHEVSPLAIHKGEKVYLDTQLDRHARKVLARNVRVQTKPLQADASGQIVSFDPATSTVIVKDDLSAQNVSFHVLPDATVDNQGHPGSRQDIQPGAIVDAHFVGGQQSGRNDVKQLVILAAPGADYIFDGRVTNIDLRNQTVAVENGTDGKIYDLKYDPRRTPIGDLKVGTQVNVTAKFNGTGYQADSFTPAEGTSVDEDAAAVADSSSSIDDSGDSDKTDKKAKKDKKSKKDKSKDKDDEPDAIPD